MRRRESKSKSDARWNWLGIYVMAVLLTPIFNLGVGIPIRIDDAILIFLLREMPQSRLWRPSFPGKVFIWLSLSLVLSLAMAAIEDRSIAVSDVNDVLVFMRIYLIIALVTWKLETKRPESILAPMFIAVCISGCIAALQYLRVEPFASLSVKLYSGGSNKYRRALQGLASTWRVVATYGNPNYSAMFFALGSFLSLRSISISRKQYHVLIHVLVIGMFFCLAIFAVSSRSGLVLMVLGLALMIFLPLIGRRSPGLGTNLVLAMALSLVFGVIAVSQLSNAKLTTRVKSFAESAQSSTGLYEAVRDSRFGIWQRGVQRVNRSRSWLLGFGTAPPMAIDSGLIHMYYTQGAVGVSIVLIMWAWVLRAFLKLWPKNWNSINNLVFTSLLAIFMFSFCAEIVVHAKAGPVLAVFLSLCVNALRGYGNGQVIVSRSSV